MLKAITPKTKALIINSPSNPTGSAYTRKDLKKIAEIAISKNIFVISDEIYEKIVYDGFEFVSIASLGEEIKKKTIIVHGVAKTYSMTGWRIGYTAGPEEIVTAMNNIQSQSTSNPNSIAQKASVEALLGPQEEVDRMVSAFDQRRNYIVDRLNQMKGVSCYKPVGPSMSFRISPPITEGLTRERRLSILRIWLLFSWRWQGWPLSRGSSLEQAPFRGFLMLPPWRISGRD